MKKLYVFMILLLLVSPLLMAAAKTGTTIKGTITAIDADAMTITILADYPRRYINDTITVQVTNATILKECVDELNTRISFDDLFTDEYVKVKGTFSGDILVAINIIAYPEGQP